MNKNFYKHVFYAECPDNGVPIRYLLTIESYRMINVFDIQTRTESMTSGYQEDLADALFQSFGEKQTLEAHHHGFFIRTVRSEQDEDLS